MAINATKKNDAASYISAIAKKPLPPAKAAAVPKMVDLIKQRMAVKK